MTSERQDSAKHYSIHSLPPVIEYWKTTVEGGASPEFIAQNCYHENAELKGTIAKDFVQGYEKIRDYFVKFTDGKNDVQIQFETIEYDEAESQFKGDYTFHWKDSDGINQSLPAIYQFTPTDSALEDARIARHYSHPR